MADRLPGLPAVAAVSPRVRKAVEAGDIHGIWRALWWAVHVTGLPKNEKELVARRRDFRLSMTKSPELHSAQGYGTGLFGRKEYDPGTDTFVMTYAVFLMGVPLIPIRQYLAQGDVASRVDLLGVVPTHPLLVIARWGLLGGTLGGGALAAAIYAVWWTLIGSMSTVHMVNGLYDPIAFDLPDEVVTLGPGEATTRRLPTGPLRIDVTRDAGPVDVFELDLVRGQATVLNPRGAAELAMERHPYGPVLKNLPDAPDPVRSCDRLQVDVHMDYAFQDLPLTVRTEETRVEWVTRMMVVGLGAECIDRAQRHQDTAHAEDLWALLGAPEDPVASASMAMTLHGPDAALAMLEGVEGLDAALLRQVILERSGRTDSQTYPDGTPAHAVLRARAATPAEAAEQLRAARVQWPDDPDVMRETTRALLIAGDFEGAVAHYDAELGEADAVVYVAEALLALDRPDDAKAMLLAKPGAWDPELRDAVDHATGVDLTDGIDVRDRAFVLYRIDVLGEPMRPQVLRDLQAPDLTVLHALVFDGAGGLKGSGKVKRPALAGLPESAAVLLYAHARQAGEDRLMDGLRSAWSWNGLPFDASDASDPAALDALLPRRRAALALALSIDPTLRHDADALRAQAIANDHLNTLVTAAATHWPQP
jgi:hypothetical protein